MTEINLTAQLGPEYNIVFQQGNTPLKVGVGTSGASGVIQAVAPTVNVAVVAQEDLGAYRAVGYDGLLSLNSIDSLSNYAGITKQAVTNGNSTNVVRIGAMEVVGWNWTPNQPIFISANGVLSQNPPSSGPIRRIGWAITTTKVNLDPYPIITGV